MTRYHRDNDSGRHALLPSFPCFFSQSLSRRVQLRRRKNEMTRFLANRVVFSLNSLHNSHSQTSVQLPSSVVQRLHSNIWQSCQQFQRLCCRSQSGPFALACLSGTSSSFPSSVRPSALPSAPCFDYSFGSSAVPVVADKIDLNPTQFQPCSSLISCPPPHLLFTVALPMFFAQSARRWPLFIQPKFSALARNIFS